MLKRSLIMGCVAASGICAALAEDAARVALVGGDLSSAGGRIAQSTEQVLKGRGIRYDVLAGQSLTDSSILKRYDLLVYAGAEALPMTASLPLQEYLQSGRDLLALGAPPFSEKFWPVEDGFLSQEELDENLKQSPAADAFLDFQQAHQREGWNEETNHEESRSGTEFLSEDANTFMRLNIVNFTGWDMFSLPVDHLGNDNDAILRFKVRGASQTTELLVELLEEDGSRWMATAEVSPEWSSVLLWPGEFKCWHDGGPMGRGGDGDAVKLSQVAAVKFGLATSHITLSEKDHQVDIDDVVTVRNPALTDAAGEMPSLDGLTPDYKYFPVTGTAAIKPAPNQVMVRDAGEIKAGPIASVHPRPMGLGYLKDRPYRFVPLLNTYNADGRRSGYLAWMMINEGRRTGDYPVWMFLESGKTPNPYAGSRWAVFGTSNPADYEQPSLQKALGQVVQGMLRGTFLMEGGSEHFIYTDSPKEVLLGAHTVVSPLEQDPRSLKLLWTVTDADGETVVFRQGQSMYRQGSRIPETDGGFMDHFQKFQIEEGLKAGTYIVTTELMDEDGVIDRISHEMNVWKPKPVEERKYVTTDGGQFMLNGKPWFGYGINYMPSSGVALENTTDYEFFVNRTAYDPAIIDEDLEMLQSIGFNLISTFIYYRDIDTRNILDLLLRAEKYGMKVNLGLRPHADPMQFNVREVEDLIRENRLAEHDAVIAYDLAWERNWGEWDRSYGTYTGRKGYDEIWELWINDQYGSLSAAEKEWGVEVPRRGDGRVTGPSDEQIDTDGPWRNMVAAYRSFADWYTGYRMMKASDAIRAVDPNHLISFRMHNTGDPTQKPSFYPFDMKALAPFLDIMEPEAYGRIGDWDRVKPGLFTGAYSRMVASDKPLYWSEFGHHVWTGSNFEMDEARVQFQADYYRDFLTMCRMSRVNAVACWWNAAGYRINENSDFGVFNPDKSDRPVTKVLREFADVFKNPDLSLEPDVSLTFDRDRSSRGLNDEYVRLEEEYWKLTDEGKFVGLTTPGHGTTTADVPLDAVGNGSDVKSAPAKYINATFRQVQIRQGQGLWRTVQSGDRIPVRAGAPVEIRALAANTDYATWLSARSSSVGAVVLTGRTAGRMALQAGLKSDTPHMSDGSFEPAVLTDGVSEETDCKLRLQVTGREIGAFGFGEVFHLELSPQ
ncbi:glycoside hydrolase 5 family protein [Tichowtungia aerotolerans]|uniref:Glycoside hydrolase family 42 N-terminal domain-containing protein n=1 Tax=Tichowtungia aerotolerans TaxID=2697043 RepID=A0A6P1M789_9BACT|nr:hypothetical protein [Tichowtungia aerotolerans]QHI69711.1 hypothetical protein GT409_09685 [Tichowtungia aerotolerans]